MRAAYVDTWGDAASIRHGELPDPDPGDDVLVRVDAVAVNRIDTHVRAGRWRTPVAFPLVVGRDLVGTTVTGRPGLPAGTPVWTNSAGYDGRPGASAELVAVAADRLYPLPAGVDPPAFVAAVHPGATAHGALDRARLRSGETLAVVGANGSVGMCLVQRGAELGARVVAVVRDARAADRLRRLGASSVLTVPRADDVPARLPAPDVLVDTSGQVPVGPATGALAPRGRMVLVAGRATASLDVWPFYTGERQLIGFIMSAMGVGELASAAAWMCGRATPLEVAVGEVGTFADAADAHARLEEGRLPRVADGAVGRLVLTPA